MSNKQTFADSTPEEIAEMLLLLDTASHDGLLSLERWVDGHWHLYPVGKMSATQWLIDSIRRNEWARLG